MAVSRGPAGARPWRLGARTRKAVLAVHIASAGAWIGIDVVMAVVIFTALFVGGVGNYRGVLLGVLLVPILFLQLPQFLPQIGYPGLTGSLEWIIVGLVWMAILLLRPQGILPERRPLALPDLSREAT